MVQKGRVNLAVIYHISYIYMDAYDGCGFNQIE